MEKKDKVELKKATALELLSGRLNVSSEALTSTLKATVIKDFKMKNGNYRKATDQEFIAFVVVANTYKLNPIIKEIYAYLIQRAVE